MDEVSRFFAEVRKRTQCTVHLPVVMAELSPYPSILTAGAIYSSSMRSGRIRLTSTRHAETVTYCAEVRSLAGEHQLVVLWYSAALDASAMSSQRIWAIRGRTTRNCNCGEALPANLLYAGGLCGERRTAERPEYWVQKRLAALVKTAAAQALP